MVGLTQIHHLLTEGSMKRWVMLAILTCCLSTAWAGEYDDDYTSRALRDAMERERHEIERGERLNDDYWRAKEADHQRKMEYLEEQKLQEMRWENMQRQNEEYDRRMWGDR
jgi:hypothetical protein